MTDLVLSEMMVLMEDVCRKCVLRNLGDMRLFPVMAATVMMMMEDGQKFKLKDR